MQARYVIVERGEAVNIFIWDGVSPWTQPDNVLCLACPDHVGIGWRYDGVNWIAPIQKPEEVTPEEIIPQSFAGYIAPDESIAEMRSRLAALLQELLSRFGDSTGQLLPLTSGDKVRMYEMIVANSAAGDWLGVGSINLEG
jgi:hypothetical protein